MSSIHSCEHLRIDLEDLGMSQAALAGIMNVPKNRISEIIKDELGHTADTVIRLARWMGTTLRYWLNLQVMYELLKAEQEHGEKICEEVTS